MELVCKAPSIESQLVSDSDPAHSDLNFVPKNEGAGCDLIYISFRAKILRNRTSQIILYISIVHLNDIFCTENVWEFHPPLDKLKQLHQRAYQSKFWYNPVLIFCIVILYQTYTANTVINIAFSYNCTAHSVFLYFVGDKSFRFRTKSSWYKLPVFFVLNTYVPQNEWKSSLKKIVFVSFSTIICTHFVVQVVHRT